MHAHLLIPFVLLWCAAIAWSDWQLRRIPNSLVAAGFTVALLGLVFQGQTLFGIGPSQSLFGAAIGLLVFLPLYMLKIMGAGDVKLFAAIGALCGPWGLLPVWLIASLLAGAHAFAWISAKRFIPHLSTVPVVGAFGRLPYGAHLAVGVACITLQPELMTGLVFPSLK